MYRILTILFLLFTIKTSTSQFYGRKHQPLMELNGTYSMSGWFISPGLSYMLPNKIKWLGGQENPDIKPRGRIGLYLELGRYHIFPEGGAFFNYMDYSVAFKRLSGSETQNDVKKIFRQNYLSGNFNINNIYQLSDRTFLQNSLGVNLDFRLWQRSSPDPSNKRLLASLHYKFGFGLKLNQTLFIIPSVETPILNFREWDKGRSSYSLYNSYYRPLVFSFRFIWLRSPSKGDCPPVYVNPGDKAKQDQYFMDQQ